MAAAVQCPSFELNQQLCPCAELSCARHGVCCECMRYHMSSTQWPKTACMRGNARPQATMSLPMAVPEKCPNRETNVAACRCTYTECERHAFCCVCVRNHWKPDASSTTACMRD